MTDASQLHKIKLDRDQIARWNFLTVTYLLERGGLDVDKPAIVFEGRQRTYGELRDRARRVAHALVECGIEPMDRVAVLSSNRLEFMEIEGGIAGARAIMVALNWRLHKQELRNLLQQSEARALFVEPGLRPAVAELRAEDELPQLEVEVVLGEDGDYEALCASASSHPPPDGGRLDDPHEIIYTSGTTGQPKGALWSNGTLIWNSIQQIADYQLGPDDSAYAAIDLHWIGGRHNFTWPLLHQGGTAHVKRSGGWDAREIASYVATNGITHVLWVPTMLFDILRLDGLDQLDFSALRAIMCGGAPVSPSLTARAQQAFPAADFVHVYGLTEGGSNVTVMPARYAKSKRGSAGRPSMHNEIRIVGPDGSELPPNEVGEILVRGPAVTGGYWEAPELTAELIGEGWLYTGDLGYLDEDGFLYVAGREKELIISGGINIFPAEVEDVLRGHEAILDVAVIGLPDDRWGESVCAVVTQNPDGPAVDEQDLVEFCRAHLASYKKPTRVVQVDELPRTPSGKVRKSVLVERLSGSASTDPRP